MHLLAHEGGWDEWLLVAVPIALFAAVLWLANRRAVLSRGDHDTDPESGGERGPGTDQLDDADP